MVTQPTSEPEIEPADPVARRNLAALVVIVVAGGMLVLGRLDGFLDELERQAVNDPEGAMARASTLLQFALAGLSIVCALCGAVILRISVLTFRSGQFPPPGSAVIRDLPVVAGPAARLRGLLGVAGAGVLFVSALYIITLFDRFERLLG